MKADLRAPNPMRPASFRRFLARADRRARRRNGSGSAYSLTVLALFYVPSAVVGAAFELTGPPPQQQPWLTGPAALAALMATLALASAVWSSLGPIPAPQAWATWVLSTPVDRGVLLARRVWARLALAAVPGLALGAATATSCGLRDAAAAAVVSIGVVGGVAACAVAILRQRHSHRRRWMPWAVAMLALGTAAGLQVRGVDLAVHWWWLATAATAIMAAVTVAAAVLRARHIPPDRLIAAGRTSSEIFMALTELSLEPLGGDHWRGRRTSAHPSPLAVPDCLLRLTPRRPAASRRRASSARSSLTGVGQEVLAAVCWRRLRRNTIGLARFIVTAAVFYPVAATWHGSGTRSILAAAGVIAATIAVSGLAGTARRFQRDPHLPAHLGLDPRASRRTVLTIPAIMAAIWAALTAPAMAMGGSIAVSVFGAALGFAVVAYRLTRPEFVPSYAVGQQVSTDLARRFTRGPAQLIAACVLAIILATSL